jgi:hypothetical protein
VLSSFVRTSCESELGWKLQINAAVNRARGQTELEAFGFGAARATPGTSRVAKTTSRAAAKKKQKPNPSEAGGIEKFLFRETRV